MKQSRLYYDVTQLVHWPGKLTGIPRVMHELASRFAAEQPVTFVTWVKEQGSFCSVDFNEAMQRRENSGQPKQATQDNQQSPRRSAKQQLARVTRKISPRLHAQLVRQYQSHSLQQQPVSIDRDDQVIIPWGEWWDPTFTDYISSLQDKRVRVIQIIHDMATTLQPQFFEPVAVSPTDYNRIVLPRCALVLAVSENTKRELSEWLKSERLSLPPIAVFREGDDLAVSRSQKPRDSYFKLSGLKGNDYILTVGTIEAKKNHHLYYYVYKLAAQKGIDLPKLVIAGRKGWGSETTIDLLSRDPQIKDKIVILHGKSDEELSWLYDNCLFTILASFHEGWGIPIAESIARGKPCLCSGTSSMVEVAKGHTQLFNPLSPDDCLAAIQKLLKPKELAAMNKKVRAYKLFSWDESYAQVATLIQEIN